MDPNLDPQHRPVEPAEPDAEKVEQARLRACAEDAYERERSVWDFLFDPM